MSRFVHYVESWKEAERLVEWLSVGLPILCGAGDPVGYGYVGVYCLDADAGEGTGYRVVVRPDGDGIAAREIRHLIYVGGHNRKGSAAQALDSCTTDTIEFSRTY